MGFPNHYSRKLYTESEYRIIHIPEEIYDKYIKILDRYDIEHYCKQTMYSNVIDKMLKVVYVYLDFNNEASEEGLLIDYLDDYKNYQELKDKVYRVYDDEKFMNKLYRKLLITQ